MKEKIKKSTVDVETINFEELKLIEKNEIESKKYMKKVRKTIMIFTDITKVTDDSMDVIFGAVHRRVWLTALKKSDKKILWKVQKGMSKRAAVVFSEDLDVFHVENVREIELAKQQILEKILLHTKAQDIEITGLDIPILYGDL